MHHEAQPRQGYLLRPEARKTESQEFRGLKNPPPETP
jgi:hypothetical protein